MAETTLGLCEFLMLFSLKESLLLLKLEPLSISTRYDRVRFERVAFCKFAVCLWLSSLEFELLLSEILFLLDCLLSM